MDSRWYRNRWYRNRWIEIDGIEIDGQIWLYVDLIDDSYIIYHAIIIQVMRIVLYHNKMII